MREARDQAGKLSRLYQAGRKDLRQFLEHESAEERAKIEAAKRAREETERQAKAGTHSHVARDRRVP